MPKVFGFSWFTKKEKKRFLPIFVVWRFWIIEFTRFSFIRGQLFHVCTWSKTSTFKERQSVSCVKNVETMTMLQTSKKSTAWKTSKRVPTMKVTSKSRQHHQSHKHRECKKYRNVETWTFSKKWNVDYVKNVHKVKNSKRVLFQKRRNVVIVKNIESTTISTEPKRVLLFRIPSNIF